VNFEKREARMRSVFINCVQKWVPFDVFKHSIIDLTAGQIAETLKQMVFLGKVERRIFKVHGKEKRMYCLKEWLTE